MSIYTTSVVQHHGLARPYLYKGSKKRYSIIDQQIAQHFAHCSEYLYHPLPFYATQNITPFLTLSISANHNKG